MNTLITDKIVCVYRGSFVEFMCVVASRRCISVEDEWERRRGFAREADEELGAVASVRLPIHSLTRAGLLAVSVAVYGLSLMYC